MAARFILDGSLATSNPNLTALLRHIRDSFPEFFNSLLTMSDIGRETVGSDLFDGLRNTADIQYDQINVSTAARLEPQ